MKRRCQALNGEEMKCEGIATKGSEMMCGAEAEKRIAM